MDATKCAGLPDLATRPGYAIGHSVNVELHFDHGTLVVPTLPPSHASPHWRADERTGVHRAAARDYRAIVTAWHRQGLPFTDVARQFAPLPMERHDTRTPYPYQQAALQAWQAQGSRGVVVLPTGAGKTLLAVLAMVATQRPTLVVVPTLDLLQQWRDVLTETLRMPVGMIGGGAHERLPITCTTYDSAALHTEFIGNAFGLLICDECHHLPAPSYQFIAAGSLAPYRLGLSATPERADNGERVCQELLGPVCYRAAIDSLAGDFLAPYDVHRVEVALSADEAARYQAARALYLDFVRGQGIRFSAPDGWAQFIMRSQQSDDGRAALRAYREQKRIALTSEAKLATLWRLLVTHRHDRAIVFTSDNETVYRLSQSLFIPAITHHTKPQERLAILGRFAAGELSAILTSRVLNEGVDVPDANVGIVLSGSGSVREHVQRLGRLLRKRPDKRAVLYEICSAETTEQDISERRRQHDAYQRVSPDADA